MRIHDLRHFYFYANRALALGEGPLMIGRLSDHARIETTARQGLISIPSARRNPPAARFQNAHESHLPFAPTLLPPPSLVNLMSQS